MMAQWANKINTVIIVKLAYKPISVTKAHCMSKNSSPFLSSGQHSMWYW